MLLSSLLMDEEAKAQRRKGIQDSRLFLQPCGDLIRPMLVVHKRVHKRVLSSALGRASSQAWGNHSEPAKKRLVPKRNILSSKVHSKGLSVQMIFKLRPKDDTESVLGVTEVVSQVEEIARAKALRQGEAWSGLGQPGGQGGWGRRCSHRSRSQELQRFMSGGGWVLPPEQWEAVF